MTCLALPWAWQTNTTASADRIYHSSGSGLTTGQQYTASVWAKLSAVGVPIALQAADSAGTNYLTSSNVNSTGGWQRLSVTFTANAGSWRIAVRQQAAATGVLSMTGVMLTEGVTVHGYADGNAANWIWNGTAGSSTSTGPAL
ncbi:carbohydrate binding domain-containing protein [Candidatus Saccharibacteria bacterium]|nr:carbohydrate binding domain-containing protein [Candidatus Saccharibacteria bacterium]